MKHTFPLPSPRDLCIFAGATVFLAGMAACRSTAEPHAFPTNPTDSGSRYSEFGLPGSRMDMQNTDLED